MRTITPYRLTRDQLLADLYTAYYDARRHKRNKPYQLRFEENLEANLDELCEELWTRTYKPRPSTCFIIREPKPREVFAADFRDRIVHHLYFNYTHEMYERTFIQDSYSCIKGRGTHYGIKRLESHIRKLPLLEELTDAEQIRASVNSFLGVLSHYCTYSICIREFCERMVLYRFGWM